MPRLIIALLSVSLVLAACGGPGPGAGGGNGPGEGNDIGLDDDNGFDDDANDGGSGTDDSDDDGGVLESVTYRLVITGGSMAGTYDASEYSQCVRDFPSEKNFTMHTLAEGAGVPSMQMTVADGAAAGSGEGTDEFTLFITFYAENGDTTVYQLGRDSSGELGAGGRAAVDQQATSASVHVDGIATTLIATSTRAEVLDEGVRIELEADCHAVSSPS